MKQELTCSPAALPTQQAGVQVMSAGHLANKWPCASPLPILQAGMCFHCSVPGHQPSKLFCLHTPPGTSEPAPASWATLSSLRASPAHAPSLRGTGYLIQTFTGQGDGYLWDENGRSSVIASLFRGPQPLKQEPSLSPPCGGMPPWRRRLMLAYGQPPGCADKPPRRRRSRCDRDRADDRQCPCSNLRRRPRLCRPVAAQSGRRRQVLSLDFTAIAV